MIRMIATTVPMPMYMAGNAHNPGQRRATLATPGAPFLLNQRQRLLRIRRIAR